MKTSMLKMIIELNIFKYYPSTDRQIQFQRYATRLDILLVVISLVILTCYYLLIKTTYRSTVHNPSDSEYVHLEQTYSDTLLCLCSSISTNHSTFISVEPHYHQLCSSDLVSLQWNRYLFLTGSIDLIFSDYRVTAPNQFQSLTTFCQQAQQTIENALHIFFQTQYVSSQVVFQQKFHSQINLLINDWKSATRNRFSHTIQLIQAITKGNQLSNVFLDSDVVALGNPEKLIMIPKTYPNCSCALSSNCLFSVSIYNYSESFANWIEVYQIRNFFRGCYIVEALLASTLECFYSLSCLMNIDQYISGGKSSNFSALNESRNSPNETIELIINRLMVDSWVENVSFASYYNSCAPVSCAFEYIRRNNLFVIVTTVIGVFGGLSLSFNLIILIILRLTEKLINDFSWIGLMRFMRRLFICHSEHQMIRRLHFVLVVASLVFLYLFSAFTPQFITIKVEKPSLFDYQDLFRQFPDSLQCSCSQISIQHQLFLTITPRFHQVCSSVFVSEQWIEYLYGTGNLYLRFAYTDFRYSAPAQFQSLAALCQQSQQTVNEAILQLVRNNFISSQVLSRDLFNDRIQATVTQFQLTTSNLFLGIFSFVKH